MGVGNCVVCPPRLDEWHGDGASGRTDALELATRLDRYVAHTDRALAVGQVSTKTEEQVRAHKHLRQPLRKQRLNGDSGSQPGASAWSPEDPPLVGRGARETAGAGIGPRAAFGHRSALSRVPGARSTQQLIQMTSRPKRAP